MGYLTLVDNLGSYVGLGIPLVRRRGNCFLDGSGSELRTPSTDYDWFGISVKVSGGGSAILFFSSSIPPSIS